MSEYALSLYTIDSDKGWVWYGIIYIAAMILLFVYISSWILEHFRYENTHSLTTNEDRMPIASTADSADSYGLVETPRSHESDVMLDIQTETHHHRVAPLTLAFRDLWYGVPDPANPKQELQLLKGISGFALPGTMTALMGSSGAGKTTLMDVIAGRKTGGTIRGEILLNGHPASALAINRATGYCEQMDIHSEASTFREALTFSAFLRQSSDVPDNQKFDSVEEVLDLLDLRSIADQTIHSSSVEQMKRLTIGVELAAQPSVLFLDEPTSGLDARSAKLVMDGVRKVANSGRTVVCTIHQPSTEVFMLFDSLLLLKRGGETVFFGELGENGRDLVGYLEAVPGVTPIQDGENPATWMLDAIGAGVGSSAGQLTDFASVFKSSATAGRMDQQLQSEGVGCPVPGEAAISFTSKRAASAWTQATLVSKRFLALYWRTPAYNATRTFIVIFIALLVGLAYLQVNYDSYQGINSGAGMIFMTTLFTGATSYHSVIPFMAEERPSFYRERASQTYNALWYFVGASIAEIPFVFSAMFIFTAIYFPMAGLSGAGAFFLYWIGISLHVLTMAYIGQLLAFASPTVEIAGIVSVLISTIFTQLIGFNPAYNAIPMAYRWLYEINPSRFSFSVVAAVAFGDCPSSDSEALSFDCCQKLSNLPVSLPSDPTIKQYFEQVFNVEHVEIGPNFLYMIVVVVIVRLLSLVALRFVNYQRT
ncbi:hypothetical protein Poli38472_011033 [Pythium oligandrum]|uniref:ABC transporter domain-containing protein n=1 Tax=Pythium oligandrum TaxID=41045 RepID=A0A8K1CR20_PYTOL|nr:hypothetical protein Poli38472_011033 [Pythium oligandrum]|eukprot:TMW67413.1 hypothetical protein Poli38472_011033 [Pythium oligandrum]